MRKGAAIVRGACVAALGTLLALTSAVPCGAQSAEHDAEARAYFERGREAFDAADYERALAYFRHAYRLSERPELQYNIGVAADRLQREDEALEAFQQYLDGATDPEREAEVRERITALRSSIDEREATERALVDATIESRADAFGTKTDQRRVPRSAIIGGSTLAAVGVAGVSAMAFGLARNGSCSGRVDGECVSEHSTTAWTYVYGGLGAAALAASATWFAVAKRRNARGGETTWQLTPTGLRVSGRF